MPVRRFLVYHKKMIVKDSFVRRFRLYASVRLTRDRFICIEPRPDKQELNIED